MSLSLIGIISIQAYYIQDSVNNEKERFKFNVLTVLNNVSNTIQENEFEKFSEWLQNETGATIVVHEESIES